MKHKWEKSGRILGEYWENLDFRHLEKPFFTSVFCSKKHQNSYQMFERAFECFQNLVSPLHFAPYTKHSVLCILPKPYFHCSRSGRCSKCCQKVHLQVRKPLISCSFSLSWMYQTTLIHARFQSPIVSKLPPKTRK